MPKETGPKAKKEAGEKPPASAKTSGGKTGKTAPAKRASTKPAAKRLAKVPEQYVFYCCDGAVYRDMAELAAGLAAMTDETFVYHSNIEKRDFSNWVRDIIEDIELAEDLAEAASRLEAARCVADRLIYLSP